MVNTRDGHVPIFADAHNLHQPHQIVKKIPNFRPKKVILIFSSIPGAQMANIYHKTR